MEENCEIKEAVQKAYGYLAKGDRSIFEMKLYLKKRNFTESVITETINYLQNNQYLNDMQYADKFLDIKMNTCQWGINKIKAALIAKGIERHIINAVLAGYTKETEYLAAVYQLEKKFKQVYLNENKQIIARYLGNKGFSAETIGKIINDYYKT
ncbi:MAG: RecX family transcriptional regulator [Clostridia bacterium]|nr:RecX family transcriptional regulator [Clostridia bacterium]